MAGIDAASLYRIVRLSRLTDRFWLRSKADFDTLLQPIVLFTGKSWSRDLGRHDLKCRNVQKGRAGAFTREKIECT